MLEKVAESNSGGGMDKRAIGALVLELSLTVVGYFILYQSAKSLIGMIDPTKKDKDSVAQVRGRWATSVGGCKRALGTTRRVCGRPPPSPFMRLNAMRRSGGSDRFC